MTPKEFAALAAQLLVAQALAEEDRLWVCLRCCAQTSGLSEVCSACGVEDCEQGS